MPLQVWKANRSGVLVKIREVVERIRLILCPSARVEFDESPKRAFEQVRSADPSTTYAQTGWLPWFLLTQV